MTHILITTYDRPALLRRSLESLFECTQGEFQVLVSDDGSPGEETAQVLGDSSDKIAQTLLGRTEAGLVDSFNRLFEASVALGPVEFVCYAQDDVTYTPDWLKKCVHVLELFPGELGFVTGFDAPEHTSHGALSQNGVVVVRKLYTRATHLIARREFWESVGPVPRRNPDGSVRGRPDSGRGSNVDWYWMKHAERSSEKQGKMVGCLRGLVEHQGEGHSTW